MPRKVTFLASAAALAAAAWAALDPDRGGLAVLLAGVAVLVAGAGWLDGGTESAKDLTLIATVYLGWHYVVDDIAGIAIGALAVLLASLLTGFDPRAARAPVVGVRPPVGVVAPRRDATQYALCRVNAIRRALSARNSPRDGRYADGLCSVGSWTGSSCKRAYGWR